MKRLSSVQYRLKLWLTVLTPMYSYLLTYSMEQSPS